MYCRLPIILPREINEDINGISVLEAASDSRRWEHIIESLKKEEIKHGKLLQLKELWKKSGVSAL